MTDEINVDVDPPNMQLTFDYPHGKMAVEVMIDDALDMKGGVEVLESTNTGIVIEDESGETDHIDLRNI